MGLIKKPNELTVKTTLSALIYGQPGMGKTTLALSAPNPVLFDYDGGIHRVNAAHRVPTVQITSWEETNEVLSSEEIKEFDTIVIDTAGKMLSFMDKFIMQTNPKMKKADGTLSLQGYGVRKNMFINFVNQVSLMGKSVIFVAHEREEKNGDDKQIRPEIGGSSAGDLIKEGIRVFHYDKNAFLHAKTVVIDDEVCSIGTANMDTRSFELNFEVSSFIYSEKIAKEQKYEFENDMKMCEELTLEKYQNRSRIVKIKESLSRLFSDVL